jgi:hypothetical protein
LGTASPATCDQQHCREHTELHATPKPRPIRPQISDPTQESEADWPSSGIMHATTSGFHGTPREVHPIGRLQPAPTDGYMRS